MADSNGPFDAIITIATDNDISCSSRSKFKRFR